MNTDQNTFDIEAVRERLRSALTDQNLSKREASIRANLGKGYVHSILSEGKEPTISNLAAICKAIGVSLFYVLYGFQISPETEEIISRLEDNPSKRDGILKILSDQ